MKNLKTLSLPFFEQNTGYKLLYKITPDIKIGISKIIYSVGSADTSVNGYIKVVLSKLEMLPPFNSYFADDQTIFELMTHASNYITGYFPMNTDEKYILFQNEPVYLHLYHNLPDNIGVFGNILIYYWIEE